MKSIKLIIHKWIDAADPIIFPLYHRLCYPNNSIISARVCREEDRRWCPHLLSAPVTVLPMSSMPLALCCISSKLLVILVVSFFGSSREGSVTIEEVNWTRVTNKWELNCYSCPVLVKDGKKKLWEILVTDSSLSAPCTVHHLSSSLPICENYWVGDWKRGWGMHLCHIVCIAYIALLLTLRCCSTHLPSLFIVFAPLGGEYYTCCAWAGGAFFPVVLLCQFLVLAGNWFWFYILLMYLEYNTVVVLC
jgi:hypothetical protein